jgi:hypothetical protein
MSKIHFLLKGTGFRGCVRTALAKSSPAGTAENSPGRSPGLATCHRVVPQGRLKMTQDRVLGWLPEPRIVHFGDRVPQDCILGDFQPSLRDCSLAHANPGLTSWATLSRPCGTQF